MSQRYSSLEEVIKANNLDKDCTMSPESIKHFAKKAMITNSLAYILADAAETFLMDCEFALGKFDRNLLREVKRNFRQMKSAVHQARLAAKKAAEPMYEAGSGFTDDACIDSDWWYNFVKLLDDRVGVNKQKTQLLLEFLLNMPSEGEGLFKPKLEDFV
jgi:hypothetical protein